MGVSICLAYGWRTSSLLGPMNDGDGAAAVRWEGPAGRPREVMARSIEHSLALGLYTSAGAQAGFARMVTDRATFAWLCEVFVAAGHRGNGVGTFLVRTVVEHPDVAGVRQLLMPSPGRSLYRRHGFGDLLRPERWMERPAP